jgi:hypothetical protein
VPIFREICNSLRLSTVPGTPIQIGRNVPRSRTRRTQVAITSASKQIWLTMYVAIGSFSNMASMVVSSLIT